MALQVLFCSMNTFENIRWNLKIRMNVRIYSRVKKSLEGMSEYIPFEKMHKYLDE